ncbi:hypothetical protein [Streptomyces enissocaesilis]|uniref:Uncharacterized protein n=1 Tax=Streptomyces enissocaesilis TaxID=332589 RepID=A0ABN3WWU6_9ACTN
MFPVGVETVTVTAGASGYRTPDGDPYLGTIRFTPSVARVTSATHGVIALGAVNISLNASGGFSETLLATDAEGFSPTGWTYRVDEEFTNAPGRAYDISLPAGAPIVTLPALAPVASSTGTVESPAVLSVNGETGIVDLNPADVGADPAGAATAAVATHAVALDPHGDRAYGNSKFALSLDLAELGGTVNDLSTTVTAVDGFVNDCLVRVQAIEQGTAFLAGGNFTAPVDIAGSLVVNPHGAPAGYPIGQAGAAESVSILSSFAGGEDEGQPGQFDSTGRLNLYSYQRADVGSYGETVRHFLMRKDAKAMEAWYFPSGGYDVNRDPVGTMRPVVWTGAHWEANNHASNHKHWSVETPSSTGSIETRFEVRWGDPTNDTAIAGLDKTMIATNLADFVVRCTNGQEMRLTSPDGQEKKLVFSRDAEGDPQYRRWAIRSTSESETGSNAGSNWQLARYDDAGIFQDNPIVVSRATGNVTLGPGLIARRGSGSASSLSLNSTSLGGGIGVLAMGNAPTLPTASVTGGGVLYAEAGALKWKGSSGTITVIAAA